MGSLLRKFNSRFEHDLMSPLRDMVDGINHAMLPWWLTIAPAQIRHAVVEAAEAVERKARPSRSRSSRPSWQCSPGL
jgi:hypothetical protein